MNKFESVTKSLRWFMAFLLVAFVAGCGGSSGGAAPSNTKAITAYSLAGVTGKINEAAKTIVVIVPNGTAVMALVATFTSTGTGLPTVGGVSQVSGTTANNFTLPKPYIVTAADGTTATYTVTVTAALASPKAITAYSLNGVTGVITEPAHTIAVTVPSGTAVTALVATFTSTGASVKVGTTVQVSGTTPNDFTTSKAYLVTAADGLTATYTVTVTVASAASKAITAYSLAGVTGTITGAASPFAIAVTMPTGTNVTALVATFTSTVAAPLTVGGVNQVSGTTANDFTNPVTYTVTAADLTTATYIVTVTFATNPTAPTLGEAGRFVILANQAITTTGTTAISNGDIGITPAARSLIAGFTPAGPAGDYAELKGSTWAGMASTSYAPDDANPAPFPYPLHYAAPHAVYATSGAMLTQAHTDQGIANSFLTATNPTAANQICETELGTLTKTRGVYKTASNVGITTGSLTLDAQGDPNAVFIFVIGGTLTTGAPGGNIVLANGAQAKNVFWSTAGTTVIGAGTIFYGNVFAWTQINVLAGAQITGSLFAITDRVTLIADTITKAP